MNLSRHHRLPILMTALAALALTACGGGGGDDGPVGGAYTIGGTVSGLASGSRVVLQNNGADDLTVSANGSFTFPGLLDANVAYAVTIKTPPAQQTCTITNGSGTTTRNVTNVTVNCSTVTNPPPQAGVEGLVGDWLQGQCSPANAGQSARSLIRVTSTGANSLTYGQSLVIYPSGNCTGTGTRLGFTNLGSVTFSRSASTARTTANWGIWNVSNGLTQSTVWARRKNEVCLLAGGTGNQDLSVTLPTAQAVEGYVDLIAENTSCYTRQ